MTEEQVREIVRLTIEGLLDINDLQKDSYRHILIRVNKKLYDFFNHKGDSKAVAWALNELSDDPYIDIIYLQYRDEKTLEKIGEILHKDYSTIMRNKRRLILKLYNLVKE